MSTSTTSTIILERERVEARLRAIVSAATSQRLSALALPQRGRQPTAARVLGDLQTRATEIREDGAVTRALEAADSSALRTCIGLMERSRDAMGRGQTAEALKLATEGNRALRGGLLKAARAVARQERGVETSIVSEALNRIGCTTTIFEGKSLTGIWARAWPPNGRGAHRRGRIGDDRHRGLRDGRVHTAAPPARSRARHAGARLTDVAEVDHGDKRGGNLIQRAAAVQKKRSMARGSSRQRCPDSKRPRLRGPSGCDSVWRDGHLCPLRRGHPRGGRCR